MNKSIIPNLFTAANLAFGVIGIGLTAGGHFIGAAICVFLSIIADGLDGRVARALGVAGPMGRELDSLSDVVGFGVSPAFLISTMFLHDIGWWSYIPFVIFSVLGEFRLARFNINTEVVHGYFQGLPIPAAGCLLATVVLSGIHVAPWVMFVTLLVVGYLMVSQVHYPDFKGHSDEPVSLVALGVISVVAIIGLVWDWHSWLVLIFALYALYGIVNTIVSIFRR